MHRFPSFSTTELPSGVSRGGETLMAEETIPPRFAEWHRCENHYCRLSRPLWISVVHRRLAVRIGVVFFLNTERSKPRDDY